MSEMQKFKVLIVGCGNIAGGFDLLQAEEELPLGHAKAFVKHGGFALEACVEPNIERRTQFQKRWQVLLGYSSLLDAGLKVGQYDVISICSPTMNHAEDIQSALVLKPKLIFCEKPVTSNLKETLIAVQACADHDVLLAVNFSRRWSPQVIQLKRDLSAGQWGSVRSVSAIYNKGILNNGSHMLDLLLYLFGPLNVASVGRAVNDFFIQDPSIDACVRSEIGFPIQLNVAHAKDYSLFELQIVTEKGVINMEDGGARWRYRYANPSEKLLGYNFLDDGEWVVPDGTYAMSGAVSNIYDALETGRPLSSTGSNAIQAQTLCEQIKKLATSLIN
jgi:predicted dehydrogenase